MNYLWELYYGGWVAPNIYYLGHAGVVKFGGIRIGGMSGIFNGGHYKQVWQACSGNTAYQSTQAWYTPCMHLEATHHSRQLHVHGNNMVASLIRTQSCIPPESGFATSMAMAACSLHTHTVLHLLDML